MSDETPRRDVLPSAMPEPQQAGGAAVQFSASDPGAKLSPDAGSPDVPSPRKPLSTPPPLAPPRPGAPSAPPRPAVATPAAVQRAEDWAAGSGAGSDAAANARRRSRRPINEPVEGAPVPEPPPTVRMPSSRVPPPGTNSAALSPQIPGAPPLPERSSDPGPFGSGPLAPEPEDTGPVIQPMRIISVASDLPAVPPSVRPPPLVPPDDVAPAFTAGAPMMERVAPPPPAVPFAARPAAELEGGWTPFPTAAAVTPFSTAAPPFPPAVTPFPAAAAPPPELFAVAPQAPPSQPEEVEALEEVEPESAPVPAKPLAPPLPVRKPVTQAEEAAEAAGLPEARSKEPSDPAEEIEPESQPEIPALVASPPPLPVRKTAPTLDGSEEVVARAPQPDEQSAVGADESVEIDLNVPDPTEQPSDAAVEAAQPRKPPPPPPRRPSTPQIKLSAAEIAAASASPPPAIATSPKPPPPISVDSAKRRQKPWWEELFGDDYIRTMDRLDRAAVRREVDVIEASLGVERGAAILDLACGTGQHAVELASRGYGVVGYDLSLAMLALAADEAQDRGQKLNFLQGDMREMAFDSVFDGVYCLATSFGYFDDEKNINVLQRMHRALRPGGTLLLDVANRDYVSPRSPSLVWFEGDGCVCMDDMYVDFFTSRLKVKRTVMFDDGRSRELDYSIRLYSLHELGKMMHESGFKVVEVTGHPAHPGVFFGSESPRIIVVAERS